MLVCFFPAEQAAADRPCSLETDIFEDAISVQLAASLMLNLISSNCVETITKPKLRVSLFDDVIL